jgi:hypothetical protein
MIIFKKRKVRRIRLLRYSYLLIALIIVSCSKEDIKVKSSGYKEPTKEELRKAMRYHGILFAEQDDKGEWYFIRNGKRCRLFAHLENQGS